MHRLGISIAVGALVAFGASAETSARAGAETSGQASVEAGKTQAQAGASSSTSAAASAQNGQANAGLASGTTFNVELSSPLDSKKSKPGDAVNGRTREAVKSEGKMVIPKGSKLLGHVTKASSRAKGEAESSLAILFDKAILKNGEEIPLNVAVQALASAESSASAAGEQMDTMGGLGGSAAGSGMAGGRGAIGGVSSAAGGAAGTVTNTATTAGGAAGGAAKATTNAAGRVGGASEGAVGGLNAAGQLTSNSQGVFGLNGLHLNLAASNATEGTIITSSGKNVHLASGTRMLLVTEAEAGSSSEQGASKKPATGQPEKP